MINAVSRAIHLMWVAWFAHPLLFEESWTRDTAPAWTNWVLGLMVFMNLVGFFYYSQRREKDDN